MAKQVGGDSMQNGNGVPLSPQLLARLESCLQEVGEFGEVHLVVQERRVRFIRWVKSVNLHPGELPGPDG